MTEFKTSSIDTTGADYIAIPFTKPDGSVGYEIVMSEKRVHSSDDADPGDCNDHKNGPNEA